MNYIAFIGLSVVLASGTLLYACIEMRKNFAEFEMQQLRQYNRMRELITELLKLKEIKKHE